METYYRGFTNLQYDLFSVDCFSQCKDFNKKVSVIEDAKNINNDIIKFYNLIKIIE